MEPCYPIEILKADDLMKEILAQNRMILEINERLARIGSVRSCMMQTVQEMPTDG